MHTPITGGTLTMSRTRRSALTLVALAAAMTAGALSFGSALAKADDMKPSRG